MLFILIGSPCSILVSDDVTGPPRAGEDRLPVVPNIEDFEGHDL
jgi:hypothetical protein